MAHGEDRIVGLKRPQTKQKKDASRFTNWVRVKKVCDAWGLKKKSFEGWVWYEGYEKKHFVFKNLNYFDQKEEKKTVFSLADSLCLDLLGDFFIMRTSLQSVVSSSFNNFGRHNLFFF